MEQILFRKTNENTETEADWLKWTYRAFQSVYGYEYQGNNLLIARFNLLMSFVEYIADGWIDRDGSAFGTGSGNPGADAAFRFRAGYKR